MIVPIYPPLDGETAEHFHDFANILARAQRSGNKEDMARALEAELSWCRSAPYLGKKALAYEATVRVLYDLTRLRWRVIEQGYGFALENPKENSRSRTVTEIVSAKKSMRNELQPVVQEQFRAPFVKEFIAKMENQGNAKKSVLSLTTTGAELVHRLAGARQLKGEELNSYLDEAVQPYLQEANEAPDHITGHRLRDIWRYFRYSWSIPQVPTPGRQLLYLVRDAGHPNHPVMGIAALNNCPLEMGEKREAFIGWHYSTIVDRFNRAVAAGHTELEAEVRWLEHQLETSLEEIDWTNLVSADQVAKPDAKIIRQLARQSQDFARKREDLLREKASVASEEFDSRLWHDEEAPPVFDDILELDARASPDVRMHTARKQLVAKKRALALSRLLSARLAVQNYRNQLADPKAALAALSNDQVRSAINIILEALKGRRAGANLLEITTCGAIAPYNRILGGKLVALLMLSPKVCADYRNNYAAPSIISSQMRNRRVTRDNSLVYLGTTSLYVHGSSQYNRIRLPAKTIAPDQQEIGFYDIGKTSGFGTVQFSLDTSRAINAFLSADSDYREVNSVFGEGTSPKLRKLKIGLEKLGFDPHKITQHRQQRLIYAAPLFPHARQWLVERTTTLPSYLETPEDYLDATKRISDFWRRRWLAKRLEHGATMDALARDDFVALGQVAAEAAYQDRSGMGG